MFGELDSQTISRMPFVNEESKQLICGTLQYLEKLVVDQWYNVWIITLMSKSSFRDVSKSKESLRPSNILIIWISRMQARGKQSISTWLKESRFVKKRMTSQMGKYRLMFISYPP